IGAGGSRETHASGLARSDRAPAPPDTGVSASQVASNVAGFGENLLNMAELQARMASIELRQNLEALRIATVIGLTGALLALAALPSVLAGVAELLVTDLGMRRGWAFLTVGFSSVVIGSLAIAIAGLWIRHKRIGFPLSAEELSRNLNWIRTVLRLSGRQP